MEIKRYNIFYEDIGFIEEEYKNGNWCKYKDIEKIIMGISEYLSHKEWCTWNRTNKCNCGYEEVRKNIKLFLMGTYTDEDKTCEIQYKRDNNE